MTIPDVTPPEPTVHRVYSIVTTVIWRVKTKGIADDAGHAIAAGLAKDIEGSLRREFGPWLAEHNAFVKALVVSHPVKEGE